MHTLNILSLNVNGLNSAVKRTRVLEYLHRKSISCALIQETHLKQSDVARFQNKYYKLIAFSCAQNKTKGVLILVNRKLNLTIEHLGSDEKGRFVFIRCKIYNNRLALFPFSRSLRVTSDDRRNWDLARETNPLRV